MTDSSPVSSPVSSAWHRVNTVYLTIIAVTGGIWIAQLHTFGVVMGLLAFVLAYFIYQKNRWAYFAVAIWCFGLLRIAMDDGYDFHQGWQSVVKLPYVVGVVFALILHEKVAIKKRTIHKDDMPQ